MDIDRVVEDALDGGCRCQVAGEVDWRCQVHSTMEAPQDTVAVWESEGYRPAYIVNDGSGSYGPEDGA